jgi:hypothetical protein
MTFILRYILNKQTNKQAYTCVSVVCALPLPMASRAIDQVRYFKYK